MMDSPPISSRIRSALQTRIQSGAQSRRWRVGGVAGLALVALLVAGWVGLTRTQQAAANPCAAASSLGSMAGPPIPGAISPAPIPAGEPRVVAKVNGEAITAEALETRVQGVLANHRQTLQQMQPTPARASAGSLPPAVLATLHETPNQVRHDALTQMIQETLLYQDGVRLGLTASPAAAQALARQIVQTEQSQPATSPARAQFEAYLRANHLSDQTFASDPRVLCGYIGDLTTMAVRQRVEKSLPPSESPTDALNAYVQRLWQSGDVRVYLPTALGW